MTKRSGELSVDWDPPERKRLRNEGSMPRKWTTTHISAEQGYVNAINMLLKQTQSISLVRSMDVAVQLVQNLKQMQSLNTPLACELFEQVYSHVLDFVGSVVNKLCRSDKTSLSNECDDLQPIQRSFAGIYQYLVEIIAKHTESIRHTPTAVSDNESFLLALPLVIHLGKQNQDLFPHDIPMLSGYIAGNANMERITQTSTMVSLIALSLQEKSYSASYLPWMLRVYSWCLSKDQELRRVVWLLFPAFCMYMNKLGKDGFAELAEKPRIAVDDPLEVLGVVSHVIGLVSCARAGGLQLNVPENTQTMELDNDNDSADLKPTTVYEVIRSVLNASASDMHAIYTIYSCSKCDGILNDASSSNSKEICQLKEVSMSDWLAFWFIASNRQHEATSARFVRNATRFVSHASPQDMTLHSSPLGQGIIRRLSSSSREIRLAAQSAILSYSRPLQQDTPLIAQTKQVNRAETMKIMRRLVQELRKPSIIEEALVLVAGGIGQLSQLHEDSMNNVLSFLVGYFCSSNVFLRAVAMEQLLLVSQAQKQPLAQLLAYFAPQISCILASTLKSQNPSPSFAQCMQMLETSTAEFLDKHQARIVPYLFVSGNENALRAVAEILNTPLPVLCVNQAAPIFAQIFLMDDQLMQQAMQRFVDLLSAESGLDQEQVEVNIPSLLRSCLVNLVFNLVLALGDQDRVLRKRAHSAIATVQNLLDSSLNTFEGCSSQGVVAIVQQNATAIDSGDNSLNLQTDIQAAMQNTQLAKFLSRHILGVLAYMNELLRDRQETNEIRSVNERRKAVVALGQLVKLLGTQAAIHVNSLVASLTPALNGLLVESALYAWVNLAESLSDIQLSADHINALLVPLLSTFIAAEHETKSLVAKAVDSIVTSHTASIKKHYTLICPVLDHPLLNTSHKAMQSIGRKMDLRQRLTALKQLLESRDATIVLCASRAMYVLLQNNATVSAWKAAFRSGRAIAAKSRNDSQSETMFVGELLRALRAGCNVSGSLSHMAAAACAACIGAIGVVNEKLLDQDSLSSPLKQTASCATLRDLNASSDERVEFACTLIVDYLARAFAMAPSPSVQMFTAYSIQELLRLVGFSRDLLSHDPINRDTRHNKSDRKQQASIVDASWLKQRWEMLPPDVAETITPLLDSQYTLKSSKRSDTFAGARRTACVKTSTTHKGWLRAWCTELVNSLPQSPAGNLFSACLGAVREGSVELLMFLLPHVAFQYSLLNCSDTADAPIVIDDNDDNSGENTKLHAAVDELLAVFSYDAAEICMNADQLRQCRISALELLDTYDAYVRRCKKEQAETASRRSSRRGSSRNVATKEERAAQHVLSAIPHDVMARAAAACGQYERAILCIEQWQRQREESSGLVGNVDDAAMAALQDLYFSIGDEDGVAGAEVYRKSEDVELTLRRYEMEGRWAHALIGHEALLRKDPNNEKAQDRWLASLQSMGQWEGAWTAACSLSAQHPTNASLRAACDAAAWRLRKWDWIQEQKTEALQDRTRFDAITGALVLGVGQDNSLQQLIQPLSLDGNTNLADWARHIVGHSIANDEAAAEIRAHMLGDLALAELHLGGSAHSCASLNLLAEQWKLRVGSLPMTYAAQEPILALQASVFDLIRERTTDCVCGGMAAQLAARTRLQAAQLARIGGNSAAALGIVAFVESAGAEAGVVLQRLQIEHAQVMWEEGRKTDAISIVKRVSAVLKRHVFPDNDGDSATGTESCGRTEVDEPRSTYAQAMLLLSQWQKATNALGSKYLIEQHENAVKAQESDRSHYMLARLYESLYETMSRRPLPRSSREAQQEQRNLQLITLQYYMVRHYCRTVMHGSRYLYCALPRLLTVWMDFGASVLRPPDSNNKRIVERFQNANRVVGNLARRLPTYNFLVVLSQLVSRICHPNEEVYAVIESILLNALTLYPQQSLWQLVAVQRSTLAARASRCNAVLAKARATRPDDTMHVGDLVQQATKLTDLLLSMCNFVPSRRDLTTLSMTRDFRALSRVVPLNLVLPLQRCLVPALPNATGIAADLALACADSASSSQRAAMHRPFPSDLPTIDSFDDAVQVMSSLQRPKKITILGSDGVRYSFLCKPKDDLRKDARLMEFNAMINQLLGADARAQKNHLRICTYAVTPLNEECGLIEWVPATVGIRHVLLPLYKEHGVSVTTTQVRDMMNASGTAKPVDVFRDKVLPLFPPVLHEWFAREFACPRSWLQARQTFTRSAAVMSIVGYILGLGDRHCENILLDQRSGAAVHVDFNCLFEKGMTLETPEKVPFRLTHNLVDAMGATGYEGAFRNTCELTLRLLREHYEALMSVLESFLHDPLVEWSKRNTRANKRASAIIAADGQPNAQATRCLESIRKKLEGNPLNMIPLSVEGQVDMLIKEATDLENLSSMYIGWAPFM
ncbi:hypothetical protein IWW36_000705 [Coemansia brasiliensis]|uniref:non-specific serine/threonine protein kinase n=1 Tax=Coemansia brasiliensis TaxID=2650707 RepID=A0A9W8ICZ7_9FUNG|nr:hypothetical protein IWW36_000705 [Coemansia brasiliensis]